MKVKGTIISSVKKFVKTEFPDGYDNWVSKLNQGSREIYQGTILATEWYPFQEGVVDPTRLIGELFYGGDIKKGAWLSGNFSAKDALTGIYKVFVLIATPQYMVKRGSKIMTSFYDPSTLIIAEERQKGLDIHITEFGEASEIVEYRIAGWMETALEICGCKNLTTEIVQSLAKGDPITQYVINWD